MASKRIPRLIFLSGAITLTAMVADAADKRCLEEIYPPGEPRNTADYRFDQEFAGDANGAYSCFLGMRPSELRKALDRFRSGVLYRDAAKINSVLKYPLRVHVTHSLAIDAPATTITIRNASDWFTFQDKHFTKTHTALVACAYLGNVTPAGGRSPGVMIGLGVFWFQSFVGNWTVKMTAVNLFPVDVTMLAKSCIAPGAEAN